MEFEPNRRVRMNLSGLMVGGVGFGAAVTDALGTIVRKIDAPTPTYLVKLLFQFKGLSQIEVPADRIRPA